MIIGLTGKNASGKGEVASYLKTKGFVYYSLSDALREKATELGLDPSRNNLIKLGNELRQKNGPEFLAQQFNNKIKEDKNENIVVDSIRSPYEAKELLKNINFLLIGIDAPIELRFERLLERNRAGDAKTIEEFKQQEARENLNEKANQQLDATFALAGKIIVNDCSLKDLHKRIDNLLAEIKQ